MSFEEKSSWLVLLAVSGIYGWYFLTLLGASPGELTILEIRGVLLATVIALVAVLIGSHIVAAVLAPNDATDADERDTAIDRFGEYWGGHLVGATAVTGIGLALFEVSHFWIANCLLAGLVLSEITTNCIKLYCYRRGF